ncbi:MAG: hypothetical protein KAG20_03950 [Cocleimonas sp.]|nr:hypothetical protein [Cocleimonas sp.]
MLLKTKLAALLSILLITTGCGIHRFDQSEVAVISVGSGQRPTVSWTPPNAYQVGLYKGEKAGDGSIGEIWNKGRQTGYSNKLNSPITIDTALEVGETYTVVVDRKDPKGTGAGFSNTHHRYVGTKIFVVK